MLAQIELNDSRAEALSKLEQSTGKSRQHLLLDMFDQYMQNKQEEAEIFAGVAQARAQIAAGEVLSCNLN